MKNKLRQIIIFKKIIINYIRWKLGIPNPFYALYYCTFGCNLSCIFCPIVSALQENEKCSFVENYDSSEMTTEQAKYAIDQLEKLGIYFILFGGGEPLLRKDLEELAFYAKSKNMITALATNGTLITKDRAKSLMDCFDAIMVSIHGLEEIDDKIKMRKGSFKKSVAGISFLKRYSGATVGINFVINTYNYHQIEDILILAKETCDFIGYISVNWDFGPEFSLKREVAKEIVDKLFELKKANKNFITNNKKYLNLFFDHLSGRQIPIKCNAFNVSIQVGPAGEFGGCERSFTVGNILNQNIFKLIKLGRSRKKELKNGCREIVCRAHLPSPSHILMLKMSYMDIIKFFLKNILFNFKNI